MSISVGVMGAGGYMGGEVLRVLLNHPQVEIAWAASRNGERIEEYHPNLYESGLKLIHPDDAEACDVVFLALPTGASIEQAARFNSLGCRVIDLGAAFRLSDCKVWERVYAQTHAQWPLVQHAVYGINELHHDEIANTRLVANPGCFASAAILALAPVVQAGLVDTQRLLVTGISGTAGVGAELSQAAHHPEIGNNLVPYNVVDHRHSYEMEQELSLLNGNNPVSVHFTPVYAPLVRGILNICHVFPLKTVSRTALLQRYREYFEEHEFIKVFDRPFETGVSWQYKPYPWVSAVNGSNYCYIGLDVDERRNRVVLFSVLDSLGKGGAQVGVENMNIMFGLDRASGLRSRALHPG
ncbi:MAG: N-acetyl-gamma-glutamyl-phosphate reductase [Gammaproteobacteria bacterium]|nr:N-acetyl-gamma-glutamyl-phosphate reductase [Gammaproteobacteria bacterium]MDH5801704.1 N-acetyl-gamma-glutamyl-phosphate reductase [Gammaproteobacteria bacterium]